MNKQASIKLNKLKRITFQELDIKYKNDVLLYEEKETLFYKNDKIYTKDGKNLKDLLRIIKIKDLFSMNYENTNILIPRTYAENHNPIPSHISVQCLFFHKLNANELESISEIIKNSNYNKTNYDTMWIENEKKFSDITPQDILYIMNRRVGGWDGSVANPVIELLCAGGHLPTVWNENSQSFETLSYIELLEKEIQEEVGLSILPEQVLELGKIHNKVSNELVVLYALFIDYNQLLQIIDFSKGNIKENIDGIYLGVFNDVMKLYDKKPNYFAGGESAKQSNFPSDNKIMERIKELLEAQNEK